MQSRSAFMAAGVIAAVGAAALTWTAAAGNDQTTTLTPRGTSPPGAEARPAPHAPPPATRPAAAGPQMLTLPATLVADETVELYAKASGYVTEIGVDIGSRVRKGDVLVRLDVPELLDELRHNEAEIAARRAKVESMKAKAEQSRLAVESALAQQRRVEAELRLCRITHTRKAELYKEKAIPQQEFDVSENQLAVSEADLAIAVARVESARGEELSAKADVLAAEAEIAVAEADQARLKTLIDYTTIEAPFDGVVTQRMVDHGAFVRSASQGGGSVLLTLDKVDRLRLVMDVPEIHAPAVHAGTEVRIQMRANGDEPLVAKVTRTSVSLRPDTRTMRAEVDLDNPDAKLIPGMYARASIKLPDHTTGALAERQP